MKKLLSILFLNFVFAQWMQAQLPAVEQARALYPDASAIFLIKQQEYKITLEKGAIIGTSSVHEQIYINKESGLNNQTNSVYTSKFVEASAIKAYTLVPKNGKYDRKEVTDIELKDSPGRNVFYDDQKAYKLVYPSVQPGAIIDLAYNQKYIEPRFMGQYMFIDYIPCMQSELVISVAKNINIAYKLFNCENEKVLFTKEEKKGETIYKWRMEQVDIGKFYSDAPNYKYYDPHLIFYVTDYIVDGQKKQLLGTAKELHAWYYDLQKNINKTEDVSLKHITDSLVVGITDELEKVKKVFYWVQDNISYVAFEDGYGGFIPRDAGLVCSRKFGDCKDMASIIHEMLRIAGVPSHLTWIGSRDIPYNYKEVPTPAVDNHMIAAYQDKKGKWLFLDATGKQASIDLYTSFIQGKQAMISISADSFVLVTVPVQDTSVSQIIDSVFIAITDNIVTGTGKVKLTGYDRLNYIYNIETDSKEERLDFFKAYFAKGNNKVNFSDIVEPSTNRDASFTMNYKLKIPDYARKNQNELYVNLNLDLGWGLEQLDEKRKVPLNFKHRTLKRLVTVFTIPTGYKADFIPPNSTLANDVFGYVSTYTLKDNTITLVRDFYINTLLLYPADFIKYNTALSSLIKSNKQTVSLVKL